MFKSKHQAELIDLDDDVHEEPGPSLGFARHTTSLAAQPARFLQRTATAKPANGAAMHMLQPGSSAGPSRHATRSRPSVSIIDLSESEAAAGLPPMHGRRTRFEQKESIDHGQHLPANAEATGPESATARKYKRQGALGDNVADPLWLDAEDISLDASQKWNASAAPKRRRSAASPALNPLPSGTSNPHGLKDFSGSPSSYQRHKTSAKAQRLGGPPRSSRPKEILDLTGTGDTFQRSQGRLVTGFIDLTEPHSPARAGAINPGNPVALASGLAATSAQAASKHDSQEVLETEEPVQEPVLVVSQDPVDLLGSPQQLGRTLAADLQKAPQGMFSCAICFDEHSLEDCYIASVCGHRMCRDAAREVVLGAVRSCSFPVLCPICQAKSEPRCIPCSKREAVLAAAQEAGDEDAPSGPSAWCCTLDADMPLLLTVEEEEQYLERSLKAAANSCADLVPCPQPNCEGMAVAGKEDDGPALVCNACEHVWCGKCNVAWHSEKSCEEYQQEHAEKEAEQGLEEYRKSNRMIKCPTCGHGIEKISGCNRVQCSGCKTQCCWLCGKKLPATNPYSHFVSGKCPALTGAAPEPGQGIPAGAWAVLPGEQPGPLAQAAQAARAGMQRAMEALPIRGDGPGLFGQPALAQPAQQVAPWLGLWPRQQPVGPGDAVNAFNGMLRGAPVLQPGAAAVLPTPAHVAPARNPARALHAICGRRRVRAQAHGSGQH